jgi:hypothetical protein
LKYYISCDPFHEDDLSRNQFMKVTSHEISSWRWPLTKYHNSHEISLWRWPLTKYHNSHEISSWRWPLTKYHKKPLWKYRCKPDGNVIFMRVAITVNSHKNNLWRWTLTKMCISWVYYHRGDAWRCTLTHYFRESKTIFRDLFCPLTKYLDSGSASSITETLESSTPRDPRPPPLAPRSSLLFELRWRNRQNQADFRLPCYIATLAVFQPLSFRQP